MKKCVILIVNLLCCQLVVFSQPITSPDSINSLININGAVLPSVDFFENIPEMEMTAKSDSTPLKMKVYNNEHPFFPPIFSQIGGSCVQSAEIGYCYTYEVNRKRNVASGDWDQNKDNCYHPLFTYNFLNEGTPYMGTEYTTGFNIIKETGCPSFADFYDPVIDNDSTFDRFTYWMNGSSKYINSMSNKVLDYRPIHFNYTYSSLNPLKHWLSDHGDGDSIGGVAIMGVFSSGWNPYGIIPISSPEEPGKQMVLSWGSSTGNGHAMTIVGYNDNIFCFDINNDGLYTVDQDVDGDQDVDLHDCERGAFKVANSRGESWGNNGFIFVPYKLMVEGLQSGYSTYTCNIIDSYQPEIIIKSNFSSINRSKICVRVGYSNSANQISPIADTLFPIFNFQGGQYPLQSIYGDTIDAAFDFGYHYSNVDFGRLFFIVDVNPDFNNPNGSVSTFSVIDYRWGEEFEIVCDQSNIPIYCGAQTILSINYDLIPHETPITSDLLLYSDMVSRFDPVVTNNSTLTVNNINIDMYESTITINHGSQLIIDDQAVFHAKKGDCKIVIDGNVQIGSGVNFIADQDASLEIIINNPNVLLDINSCEFENCTLHSSAQSVTITNSNFINGNVICENGNRNNDTATFINNSFINGNNIAIDLYSFKNYIIEQNSIDNLKSGLMLNMCGEGVPGNQVIANNNITNCMDVGIHLYESTSYISENLVSLCGEGLRLENRSTTSIYGNPNATDYSQMNRIYNEDSYEFYISKYSFPWYFHYNAIIDNDNGGNAVGDPLIYYDNNNDITPRNVEFNCWGTNFSSQSDLYPINGFDHTPTYCPPSPPAQSSPVEELYQNSVTQFSIGEYSQSKAGFMFIIDQYAQTKYAQSAMRELIPLEEYVGNDYSGLKNYYLTNPTIQSDTLLSPLASKLSNECDVKLENLDTVINYFEGIIQDPADTQDSIYAIIDLGFLYQSMDTTSKALYTGKMQQYIPKSARQFDQQKHKLLSILPVKKEHNTGIDNPKSKRLYDFTMQPNPTNSITTIIVFLDEPNAVEFEIFNKVGTLVFSKTIGKGTTSAHEFQFDASLLKPGIYFCSLISNGEKISTKKMVVM